MKLLHTADWHLGNAFYGYDREAEFKHYLCLLYTSDAADEL